MHPKHLELFTAIRAGEIDDLKDFINENAQAAWLLNDKNVSALDYALGYNALDCINILLEKLSHDANIDIRTPEAEAAFHFALFKVVKHFCKNITKEKFFELYQAPEKIFTFLSETNKNWITWTHSIATQQGAAYNAYNEMMHTKPKIQNLIRAQAIGSIMRAFFNAQQNNLSNVILHNLSCHIQYWSSDPLFVQHSGWISSAGSYLGYKTRTAGALDIMKEATDFLIQHKLIIPDDLPLETAQKILLLCTKCYPFSTAAMQSVWVTLAQALLKQFHYSPAHYHALFESLLDKQWLSTSENIPMVDGHIIQKLLPEYVIYYLNSYQLTDLARSIPNKKPLILTPGEHTELLALYPLPDLQKCFVINKPLNETSKTFLHLLLMNNKNLSLRYGTPELFMINPLKLFPYVPNRIVIDVVDQAQLAHICALAEIASHTQAHLSFAVPHKLLLEQRNLPFLHAIQQILGPKQTVTLFILDSLENRSILADMIISKNDINAGAQSKALLIQKQKPVSFYDLYQRFTWTLGLSANTADLQFRVIEHALTNHQSSMFIFHRDHFDNSLFGRIENLLKANKDNETRCIIRYDNLNVVPTREEPIITDCDFVVSSSATMAGALWQAGLCKQPGMFIHAAVTVMSRPSVNTAAAGPSATASMSSQSQQEALESVQKSAKSETSNALS